MPGKIVHLELVAADGKDTEGNSFSLRQPDPNAA
jgi:hypothetical protein